MRVTTDPADALHSHGSIATIGSFDGVHCGHQALLRAMVSRAHDQGLASVVITFYPHPREVLQPDVPLRYLTTDVERARLFEALGVDLLVLQPFDRDLAGTDARTFLQMIRRQLGMRELWVGPDFALGRGRQGDVAELARLAPELGFILNTVQRVDTGSAPISSTRVRGMLEEGDVAGVARMLGRHFRVSGIVRYGAQRGRGLGFPTANLRVGPVCSCPADGVYAVWGIAGGGLYPGVANVGRRPSFDMGERLLEAHLMGYSGALYDQHLTVLFVEWLRAERRFGDPNGLVAQVHSDMARASTILQENQPRELTPCPLACD